MRPHRFSSHAPRMVLTQGLGHTGRSSSRWKEAIATPARRLVILLHRSWKVPLEQGSQYSSSLKEDYWVPQRRKSALGATTDDARFARNVVLLCRTMLKLFCLILLNQSCSGRSAGLGGERELRDTACIRWRSLPAGRRGAASIHSLRW